MPNARGPVILIVSPNAGSARGADPKSALRRAGLAVGRVLDVRTLGGRSPQGAAWRAEGFAAAVAAGGDGTAGTVASHVANTGLPLGILPLGTANDIARSLELPLTLDEACAVVANGHSTAIDLGCARRLAAEPGESAVLDGGDYFLHALTLGWNVAFAQLATNAARRKRWGPLTYAVSAVEAVFDYRPIEVRLALEGVVASAYGLDYSAVREGAADDTSTLSVSAADARRVITGNIVNLAVIVTPVFGGRSNFRLPGVEMRDHLLDLVVIEALEMSRLQRIFEALREQRSAATAAAPEQTLLDRPGVWRFQAQAMRIETPEAPGVDVTLDGELQARTPIDVCVAPDALQILVPAAASEATGG